jgi:hypothetical protein
MAGSANISLRHRVLLSFTVVLAFLLAPAAASADCDGQALGQPFAPWGDNAYYTLVTDRTVHLRAGESTTTPPVCVSLQHPTMRFFLRNRGGLLGVLKVDVVTSNGLTLPVGLIPGLLGDDDRSPSPPLLVVGNLLDDEVSFRFTATGLGGSWTIEEVYVDPYKKG